MLLDAKDSVVLVVDVQSRLMPAIHDMSGALKGMRQVIAGARLHDVPLLVSEQYPKGLGHTDPSLLKDIGEDASCFAKTTFSCMGDEAIADAVQATGRNTLVLIGIEAPVCVLQTALEAKLHALRVVVVEDAVSSRTEANRQAAIRRFAHHGIETVTAEMVLFEWTRESGTDAFRAMSQLIR
ncbi:MAG: isochorismatase family protein [Alphaproteobacteria bacterium]